MSTLGWRAGAAVLAALLAMLYASHLQTSRLAESLADAHAAARDAETLHGALLDDLARLYTAELDALRSSLADALEAERPTASERTIPVPEIPAGTELSFESFFHDYACRGVPVVLRGAASSLFSQPTLPTARQIADTCASMPVRYRRYEPSLGRWGGLSDKVRDDVLGSADALRKDGWMVFDASLKACPRLVGSFTPLAYFANDFYARSRGRGHGPTSSWPSLFVGPAGASTAVHVDEYGTSFWMAVVEGSKQWRIVPRNQSHLLYRSPRVRSFAPQLDLFDVDATADRLPLASHATIYETTLERGDWLFVPGGCPHAVRNREPTVALAGNFVDAANIDHVRTVLAREVAMPSDRRRLRFFSEVDTRMMRSPPRLSYSEWVNEFPLYLDKYGIELEAMTCLPTSA